MLPEYTHGLKSNIPIGDGIRELLQPYVGKGGKWISYSHTKEEVFGQRSMYHRWSRSFLSELVSNALLTI